MRNEILSFTVKYEALIITYNMKSFVVGISFFPLRQRDQLLTQIIQVIMAQNFLCLWIKSYVLILYWMNGDISLPMPWPFCIRWPNLKIHLIWLRPNNQLIFFWRNQGRLEWWRAWFWQGLRSWRAKHMRTSQHQSYLRFWGLEDGDWKFCQNRMRCMGWYFCTNRVHPEWLLQRLVSFWGG